jgi:hypothetical protein
MKTFNMFLEDIFTKTHPEVLDDDGPDALDNWYSNLDIDEVIKYGNLYGFEMLQAGKEEMKEAMVEEIPQFKGTLEQLDNLKI